MFPVVASPSQARCWLLLFVQRHAWKKRKGTVCLVVVGNLTPLESNEVRFIFSFDVDDASSSHSSSVVSAGGARDLYAPPAPPALSRAFKITIEQLFLVLYALASCRFYRRSSLLACVACRGLTELCACGRATWVVFAWTKIPRFILGTFLEGTPGTVVAILS